MALRRGASSDEGGAKVISPPRKRWDAVFRWAEPASAGDTVVSWNAALCLAVVILAESKSLPRAKPRGPYRPKLRNVSW